MEIHRAKTPDGREMTARIDGDRVTLTLPDGRVIEYVEDANAPDPNGCYHADMARSVFGDGFDIVGVVVAPSCFGDDLEVEEIRVYEFDLDDGPDFSRDPGGTNWCGW